METTAQENFRYQAARKRVRKIKGFYVHLTVYLFINVAIYVMSTRDTGLLDGLDDFSNLSTAFFWGIGLLFHWMGVFGPNIFPGRDWEERKIRELMEKEKQNKWE